MDTKRRILVSTALPYANGAIHIGHMLEHIQASVWTNAMRMTGHEVHHVCADDAHGTPVMLRAEADGVKPEDLITQMREQHISDFEGFRVEYDCYHTTHSDENRELSEGIYRKLRDAGLIDEREVEQMYDADKGIFLPDRYVKGECPRCQAPEQFGDSCSKCGAAYSPVELGNPVSVISGTRPEIRKSNHFFFKLSEKQDFLDKWIDEPPPGPGHGPAPRLQQSSRNKLREWLGGKLRDWDISRDAPYFGFKIPDTKDKYFYVWLDAPIGYLASFRKLCKENPEINFDDFVTPDTNTEMYHFIGKDILYFHGLFWPAVLDGAGMRTPTRLFTHGFLSVNGEKMSKSKGTFITARSYLDLKLDPEWLRYYLASKLSDRVEDIDLNFDDFINQVNADLVGKLANIPSRVAPFLKGGFENKLSKMQPSWGRLEVMNVVGNYEGRRYREVIRRCMLLAGQINQELEQNKPWELARGLNQPNPADEAGRTNGEILHDVCTYAIQSFRLLVGFLKPILPRFAEDAEEFLNIKPLTWDQLVKPLPEGHAIGEFKHLMKRIQPNQIVRLVEANRESDASAPASKKKKKKSDTDTITIDDFKAVDLRIAKVLAAEAVKESKKLLKVTVDVGDLGQRTIFAGIQVHVDPASLVGKSVVMCANLAPRKMRFGTSEGMILAAETADGKLNLLVPDGGIDPGAKIS